jgi:hypothetical protein
MSSLSLSEELQQTHQRLSSHSQDGIWWWLATYEAQHAVALHSTSATQSALSFESVNHAILSTQAVSFAAVKLRALNSVGDKQKDNENEEIILLLTFIPATATGVIRARALIHTRSLAKSLQNTIQLTITNEVELKWDYIRQKVGILLGKVVSLLGSNGQTRAISRTGNLTIQTAGLNQTETAFGPKSAYIRKVSANEQEDQEQPKSAPANCSLNFGQISMSLIAQEEDEVIASGNIHHPFIQKISVPINADGVLTILQDQVNSPLI